MQLASVKSRPCAVRPAPEQAEPVDLLAMQVHPGKADSELEERAEVQPPEAQGLQEQPERAWLEPAQQEQEWLAAERLAVLVAQVPSVNVWVAYRELVRPRLVPVFQTVLASIV
jgi:hypothetical protein